MSVVSILFLSYSGVHKIVKL